MHNKYLAVELETQMIVEFFAANNRMKTFLYLHVIVVTYFYAG